MITKEYANTLLKDSIQQLREATTIQSLRYRIFSATINKHILLNHGYYWQSQRIDNWIHYFLKRLSAESSRGA